MTRDPLKFNLDEEVTAIPQSTEENLKQCSRLNLEMLQHLISSKALEFKQRECKHWYEQLNMLPCANMKLLAKKSFTLRFLSSLPVLPLGPSFTFSSSRLNAFRTKETHGSMREIKYA